MFSKAFINNLANVAEGKVINQRKGRKGKKGFVEGRAGKLSYYVNPDKIERMVENGHLEIDGQKRGLLDPEWLRLKIKYSGNEKPVYAHYYSKSKTIRFRCGENFAYQVAETLGLSLEYVTEEAKFQAGARIAGNKRNRTESSSSDTMEIYEIDGIDEATSNLSPSTDISYDIEDSEADQWVDIDEDPDDYNEGTLYPVVQVFNMSDSPEEEERDNGKDLERNSVGCDNSAQNASFETAISPIKQSSNLPLKKPSSSMNLGTGASSGLKWKRVEEEKKRKGTGKELEGSQLTEGKSTKLTREKGTQPLINDMKRELLMRINSREGTKADSEESSPLSAKTSEGRHNQPDEEDVSSIETPRYKSGGLTKEKLGKLSSKNGKLTNEEVMMDLMRQLLAERKPTTDSNDHADRIFAVKGPELTIEEQGQEIKMIAESIFPELHIPAASAVHNDLELSSHFTPKYFTKIRAECSRGHFSNTSTIVPSVPALSDESTVQIDASAIINWLKLISESNFITREETLYRTAWASLTIYFKRAEESIWSDRFKKADINGLTYTDKFLKFYNSAVALSKLSCSSSGHEVMRQQVNKLVNAIYRYPAVSGKTSPITSLISYIEDIIFSRVSVTAKGASKERIFQSERELIRELVISTSPQLMQIFNAIESADNINDEDSEGTSTRLIVQDYETLMQALRKLSLDKSSRREIVLRKPKGKYRAIDLTVAKLQVASAPLSLEELSIKVNRMDERITRAKSGGLRRIGPDESDESDIGMYDDEGTQLYVANREDYDDENEDEYLDVISDNEQKGANFFGKAHNGNKQGNNRNSNNAGKSTDVPITQNTHGADKDKQLMDYLSGWCSNLTERLSQHSTSREASEHGSDMAILAISPSSGSGTPATSDSKGTLDADSDKGFEGGKDGKGDIPMELRFRYTTYKGHPSLALVTSHDDFGLAYKTVKFKDGNDRKYIDKFSKSWCLLHCSIKCPFGRMCSLSHPVITEAAREKCRKMIGKESLDTMKEVAHRIANLYGKKFFRRTFGGIIDASYDDMVKKFDATYKELTTEKMNEVTVSGKPFHGGKTVVFPNDNRVEMSSQEIEIIKNSSFAAAEIPMDF